MAELTNEIAAQLTVLVPILLYVMADAAAWVAAVLDDYSLHVDPVNEKLKHEPDTAVVSQVLLVIAFPVIHSEAHSW